MAEYKNMPSAVANLVRTMLANYDSWEVHSFSVNDSGNIFYGDVEIMAFDDETYIIEWHSHEHCDSAHVSCQFNTQGNLTAYEALENASVVAGH